MIYCYWVILQEPHFRQNDMFLVVRGSKCQPTPIWEKWWQIAHLDIRIKKRYRTYLLNCLLYLLCAMEVKDQHWPMDTQWPLTLFALYLSRWTQHIGKTILLLIPVSYTNNLPSIFPKLEQVEIFTPVQPKKSDILPKNVVFVR